MKSEADYTVHHIFVLYDIELTEDSEAIPETVADGKNDSDGIDWVAVKDLNINNSSPLILKVLEEKNKNKDVLEKTTFLSWEVKKAL